MAAANACGPAFPLGSEAPAEVQLEAFAHDGGARDLRALPRWPRLRLGGVTAAPDAAPVWLLHGPPDPALLEDLEKRPLTQAQLARALPTTAESRDDGFWLVPTEPLAPDTRYTLAIGAWLSPRRGGLALPLPLAVELSTGPASEGAELLASLPAAGQAGVPIDLAAVQLAFAGTPSGCQDVTLVRDADDLPVGSAVRVVDCAALHGPADVCCELSPVALLSPQTRYRLDFAAVHDQDGAPLVAPALDFTTGPGRTSASPRLVDLPCALDEQAPLTGVCVLPEPNALHVRVRADQPSRVRIVLGGESQTRIAAPAEALAEWRTLSPNARYRLEVQLSGVGGDGAPAITAASTNAARATVAITEVRADPRGKEPDQEYVELWNYGEVAADIDGFTLADRADSAGMRIGANAPLAPGERALLVADGFDASQPDDAQPPPGTRLIRIGRALANNGLANAGEPLFLRDAAGQRLSGAPASPKPKPGVCLERIDPDPTTAAIGTFAHNPNGSCTPGR